MTVPIVAMKGGEDLQKFVDLLVPGPAKIKIIHGEGPINLVGSHCVDYYGFKEDEDDSDVVYFDFNGKSYAYDEEYTIILINEEDPSEEVLMVGTWDPEEKMPVWNEDYQP